MEKYYQGLSPHLRIADRGRSTENLMRDLLIALSPVILFSIFKNSIIPLINGTYLNLYDGLRTIIYLIVGPLFSLLLEALSLLIMKKAKTFKELLEELKITFGIFPGLFIVLISPVRIPLWILLLSIAVGEIIGKMVFGGFGQNIFNPAIVGRAFMAFAFSSNVYNSYLSSYELTIDAIASATPLTSYSKLTEFTYESIISNYGSLLDFFLGMVPGSLGETSVLAILIGYVYLVVNHVIDWKVPIIYVSTVFIITLISGLILGLGIWYPLFHIMSGGLMFGAVFMATEPVTMPKSYLGRIMAAMLLGVLTVLFRCVGSLPEGVATAIITMNIFSLAIDKYVLHMRVDGQVTKKDVPGLVIFSIIFIGIFAYDIISIVGGAR